jgi:hypothetical protein
MVDGVVQKRDGQLLNIDLPRLQARASGSMARIRSRVDI